MTACARWASGDLAATGRDDRVDPGVEQAQQQLGQLGPHSRQPDRQRVGPQDEHGAHHVLGERIADPRGVRTNQVALQFGHLVRLDPDIGQVAKSGGHPVDRLSLCHEPLDHGARRPHPIGGFGGQRHPAPVAGHRRDVGHSQVEAGQDQGAGGLRLRGGLLS